MARWEPDAKARLQAAALQLFATQGFEQTTTAQIAESVGLTERTFFRHFGDKREVLFHGQELFVQAFLDGVDSAPPDAPTMAVVASALHAGTSFFPDERRPFSRIRQTVIEANPALAERETHKMAGLAAVAGEALRARGIPEPTATLAAESGGILFRMAFAQWIADGETRSMADIATDLLANLQSLTAGGLAPSV